MLRQKKRLRRRLSVRQCAGMLVMMGIISSPALAASQEEESPVAGIAKRIFFDPTTYAPAVFSYASTRLDWDSSQVFFKNGYCEWNPDFTTSGRPNDMPVSYADGNREVLKQVLTSIPFSVANNATEAILERWLTRQYGGHRKLWRTLGWTERTLFAAYLSYQLSGMHFRQWRENVRLAAASGFQ